MPTATARVIPLQPYADAYRYAVQVLIEELEATDPEEIVTVHQHWRDLLKSAPCRSCCPEPCLRGRSARLLGISVDGDLDEVFEF